MADNRTDKSINATAGPARAECAKVSQGQVGRFPVESARTTLAHKLPKRGEAAMATGKVGGAHTSGEASVTGVEQRSPA